MSKYLCLRSLVKRRGAMSGDASVGLDIAHLTLRFAYAFNKEFKFIDRGSDPIPFGQMKVELESCKKGFCFSSTFFSL
jgi:hypothetical protein